MATENTKSKEWEGAFAAFQTAYDLIVKNPQPALLFVGVYTVVNVISLLAQGETNTNAKGYVSFADLVSLVFILPLTIYALNITNNKTVTLKNFWLFDLGRFVVLLGTMILAGLIFLGSALLLLIPLIWTLAWFALCIYAVVDKKMGPVDALKESKRISENHKGKVWRLIGVAILLAIATGILGVIPYVGIAAAAFASVISTVAFALLYRWLQK